ncbi:hypothetical protein E2C01_009095 [Portunus trituberculatus]|uniref:Uncharacterized protein n=1 Tax=Portunus trituberculatus TaxID=210409 RepID=A0A5B7D568_PORTR|nr:hypothetical protein [Portunus trituberculatus]
MRGINTDRNGTPAERQHRSRREPTCCDRIDCQSGEFMADAEGALQVVLQVQMKTLVPMSTKAQGLGHLLMHR